MLILINVLIVVENMYIIIIVLTNVMDAPYFVNIPHIFSKKLYIWLTSINAFQIVPKKTKNINMQWNIKINVWKIAIVLMMAMN